MRVRLKVREVTAEEFRHHLDALGADYRERLPDKVAAIYGLWRDSMCGVASPDRLTDLKRELHTLAGSARTFGVANVGELARTAESLLDACCERGTLPDAGSTAEMARLLDALQSAVAGA